MRPVRRHASIAVFGGAALFVGCGGTGGAGAARTATGPAVPAARTTPVTAPASAARCSGKATPGQTEGPYFKAGSPARTSLLQSGLPGTRLILTGRVLTSRCTPLTGVRLDFWQANASGVYDNSGYRLRGHQSTGAGGRFTLTTIVPGQYTGRTEHIHVKVTRPGGSTLTTQLYFPGVARNRQDGIFDPRLLMSISNTAAGKRASYDFVLRR